MPPRGERRSLQTLEIDGRTRRFLVTTPAIDDRDERAADHARPLLLVFHGGGGRAAQMADMTGFDALADRYGFVAVYPEGVHRGWNDGRERRLRAPTRALADDVGFVERLLDALMTNDVDPERVFACGISNGAMFSHRLGRELSDRIAAIGLVAGSAPRDDVAGPRPSRPVSVAIINGTADPLVPFGGGGVGFRGRRGMVLPTDETARRWAAHNGCSTQPEVTAWEPDSGYPVVDDPCPVQQRTFRGGREGSEVVLYVVDGGGHTWPSGPQYLPERVVGRVCRRLDASETLWRFFASHPRHPDSTTPPGYSPVS
jgi:polyhydroxybutyrate depolymerase